MKCRERQMNLRRCVHVIGASLSASEPHTSNTTYFRSVHLCMYNLYIYVRICTSLPPEAPDACAHARSVVLILAHLYDVCM